MSRPGLKLMRVASFTGIACFRHPSKPPDRTGRGRIPAQLRVPIGPGPCVDDSRRGLIKGRAKLVIANVSAYHLHIFTARVGHCICHEADWIGERLLRSSNQMTRRATSNVAGVSGMDFIFAGRESIQASDQDPPPERPWPSAVSIRPATREDCRHRNTTAPSR